MPNLFSKELEVIRRGCVEVIQESELIEKLKKSKSEGRPLKIKMGFDPTAPDLHLGHSLGLRKLRDFQDLGHEVLFVIGDFTARIGDPSGKNKTRPPLDEEEIKKNAATYQDQVFKILDERKTQVVFNSKWCDALQAKDIIKLAAQMNVARMLEREDFKNRYANGISISIHEFLYPLMQGYDSVALRADVEIGGQDQRFNLLVGRDLQKHHGQEQQVLILLPLLEGIDGVEKMSKSLGNSIGILDDAHEMFGRLMSIPDHLMPKYFEYLTRVPKDEIQSVLSSHPRDAKIRLAKEIVSLYHNPEIAQQEVEKFVSEFSKKEIPSDISEELVLEEKSNLLDQLVAAKVFPSKNEAKRAFQQGGVSYAEGQNSNLTKLSLEHDLSHLPDGFILKVGKRRWIKIKKS
ncbi:MAG: tyrosine--tRNA ligase [Bdellovibrionota bacterium]